MPTDLSVKEMVLDYLKSQNQWNIEKNLAELLDLSGGFVGRFDFFLPFLSPASFESILISGCSAGSELIVARQCGFIRVVGTEVNKDLINICKARVSSKDNFTVDLYDGEALPYKNDEFDVIYSGHIIEHTPDPFAYFKEHFRVLRPGGFFFLEFPNRYHSIELHTATPSFEWLPLALRDLVLRLLSSRLSPYDQVKRSYFDLVRTTLRPVSIWQIKSFMKKAGLPTSRVVATQIPAPGFVRILVQK